MSIEALPLQAGETIEWSRGQATFHRGHDVHFAVTNLSACLYLQRFLRPAWVKLPLSSLISVEVTRCTWRQGLAALVPMYLMLAALAGSPLLFPYRLHGVQQVALFGALLAVLLWMASSIRKMSGDRTYLQIRHAAGVLRYASYPDEHADEKDFDRRLILEFAAQLHARGVRVSLPDDTGPPRVA